jgi:hypothetical protein
MLTMNDYCCLTLTLCKEALESTMMFTSTLVRVQGNGDGGNWVFRRGFLKTLPACGTP